MVAKLILHLVLLLIAGAPLIPGEGGGGSLSPDSLPQSQPSSSLSPPVETDLASEDDYELDEDTDDEDTPPPAHPPISDHLPRFIVSLPDTNLFCFSIEGFELFSYNLLSTPQLHVNSFFNITRTPDGEWVRGGTDLGFLLKIKDDRVKNRQRVFKIKVYGAEKKAEFAGFGQVDMKGGAVEFSVDSEGHSNIQSSEAPHEEITVSMESPKVTVWGVSGDSATYNVYIQDSSGLVDTPSHGILGQFLRPGVGIDVDSGQLILGPARDPVPVSPGPVWDSVQDTGYQDRTCWYPADQDTASVLEGEPYDYVTEHILAHKFLFSQFNPKSPL